MIARFVHYRSAEGGCVAAVVTAAREVHADVWEVRVTLFPVDEEPRPIVAWVPHSVFDDDGPGWHEAARCRRG